MEEIKKLSFDNGIIPVQDLQELFGCGMITTNLPPRVMSTLREYGIHTRKQRSKPYVSIKVEQHD